jgi:hypothetical protein
VERELSKENQKKSPMKASTRKPSSTHLAGIRRRANVCLRHAVLAGAFLTLPVWAASPYSPPTAGLVGWWRGDGNANDSADSHNGTLLGTGFTTGLYGQAFATGSGKRVFISDDPAFQLTGSLTIGAWVKPSAPGFSILFRGDNRAGFDPWQLGGDDLGNWGLAVTDASDTAAQLFAPLPMNQWSQITGTLDDATGDMRVYVNGVLAAEMFTTIRAFGPLDPTRNPGVSIGNTTDFDFPFTGAIDEVVLYSRALSPTEVASLVPEPGSATLAGVAGLLWALVRRSRRANSI